MAVLCSHCDKSFASTSTANRHIRIVHKIQRFSRKPIDVNDGCRTRHTCDDCPKSFANRSNLRRHQVTHHRSIPQKKKNPAKVPIDAFERLEHKRAMRFINQFPDDDDIQYTYSTTRNKKIIKVTFNLRSLEEVKDWPSRYEQKQKIFFRKCNVWKSKKKSLVHKEKYRCGHNVKLRNGKRGQHPNRNTNCPFHFSINAVRKEEESSSFEVSVRITGKHNHVLGSSTSVMYRPVSEDVKQKFLYLFCHSYTPARALQTHKEDLKAKYGDDFKRAEVDRYLCPDIKWVYRLHNSTLKNDFGAQYEDEMFKKLKEEVANNEYTKLKILDAKNHNFILSIVTPFMLRVHEKIAQSSEIVFMDSTGTLDLVGCKVFIMMTNSFAGGLPLAVIVTSLETIESISEGLKMVQELINDASFGGRGRKGPVIFMTDDSSAEYAALLNVFPETLPLLCQFHVLQAMWRYIWNRKANIEPSHRILLYSTFRSLLIEKDETIFEKKIEASFENEIVQLYPVFQKHLKDILQSKERWATSHRRHLITRGQNTNNICEASMRIINEVILNRFKAYSPVHLLKILTTEFEQHYIDKLISIANGRIPQYLQWKYSLMGKKCHGIVFDGVGKVHDTINNHMYEVDLELTLCSCPDGLDGKFCEHLLVALKNSESRDCSYILPKTEIEKKKVFFIATGKSVDENDNWFKSLVSNILNEDSAASHESVLSPMYEGDNVVDEFTLNDDHILSHVEVILDDHIIRTEKLRDMFNDLAEKQAQSPTLGAAVDSMVLAYSQIKTAAALESALMCFGKYSFGTNKIRNG